MSVDAKNKRLVLKREFPSKLKYQMDAENIEQPSSHTLTLPVDNSDSEMLDDHAKYLKRNIANLFS